MIDMCCVQLCVMKEGGGQKKHLVAGLIASLAVVEVSVFEGDASLPGQPKAQVTQCCIRQAPAVDDELEEGMWRIDDVVIGCDNLQGGHDVRTQHIHARTRPQVHDMVERA